MNPIVIIEIIKTILIIGLAVLVFWKMLHVYERESNEHTNAQSRLTQIISEAISLNTSVLSRLERSIEVLTHEINHLKNQRESKWWQAPEKKDE